VKALADESHSKGLKFGIYSSSGHRTCLGNAASYDYEFEDAETFASWGVDFLKYDFCHRPESPSAAYTYRKMGVSFDKIYYHHICFLFHILHNSTSFTSL